MQRKRWDDLVSSGKRVLLHNDTNEALRVLGHGHAVRARLRGALLPGPSQHGRLARAAAHTRDVCTHT